jgi:hypothetical protein
MPIGIGTPQRLTFHRTGTALTPNSFFVFPPIL